MARALTDRKREARIRLLALYRAGVFLPRFPQFVGEARAVSQTTIAAPHFDIDDGYWQVYDPYTESTPVAASLGDDLGDVCRDIEPWLQQWDAGHHEQAVCNWWWDFEYGWGTRAVSALVALHAAQLR